MRKTYAFTFETGPWVGNAADSFHPTDPDAIKLDAKSGMLALAQQCICAIDLIGIKLFGGERQVGALRRIRDDALSKTDAGRAWIQRYEELQPDVVEMVLGAPDLAEQAGRLIDRVASLVQADQALEAADLDMMEEFLGRLAADKKRSDLSEAARSLADHLLRLKGCSANEAVEHFMKHPPS